MKVVCVLLVCMIAYAYAYRYDEEEAEGVEIVARETTKKLPGGFTFVTKTVGGGKFDCKCYRGGKKVWSGMCGVKDKKFSYSNCI